MPHASCPMPMPHAPCLMPHASCPMPHAPCPMPHARFTSRSTLQQCRPPNRASALRLPVRRLLVDFDRCAGAKTSDARELLRSPRNGKLATASPAASRTDGTTSGSRFRRLSSRLLSRTERRSTPRISASRSRLGSSRSQRTKPRRGVRNDFRVSRSRPPSSRAACRCGGAPFSVATRTTSARSWPSRRPAPIFRSATSAFSTSW